MLQKAHEIQSNLSEFKDEIRKKKLVVAFSHCNHCGYAIKFRHEVEGRIGVAPTVVERGECSGCESKLAPRRYPLC